MIETIPRGPSDLAGLAIGDFIVAADGRVVSGVDGLDRVLARLPLDRPVTLGVVRGERLFDVAVEPRLASS